MLLVLVGGRGAAEFPPERTPTNVAVGFGTAWLRGGWALPTPTSLPETNLRTGGIVGTLEAVGGRGTGSVRLVLSANVSDGRATRLTHPGTTAIRLLWGE